jgi:hypothetical protein
MLTIITSLLLTSCVSLEHYQKKMDELDSYYREENTKLVKSLGTKYYKISKDKAQIAMLLALSNLELSIKQQDSNAGFILARGNAPRPLSESEWNIVKETAIPKAKEITGLDLTMDGTYTDVIFNVFILERKNDVQINIRFTTDYTGDTYGIALSEQAPPEAVKLALPKIWNEFEKTAFVQGTVLYGDK